MPLGPHAPKRKSAEPLLLLPKRRRGRQTAEAEAEYEERLQEFCDLVKQIHSTLDIAVGSREYCYLLEPYGLGKGDFNSAQNVINDCRKSGNLPLDICAEDGSRETIGIQEIDEGVEEEAESWVYTIKHAHERYTPISFWDDLDVDVEVAVEKLSLRNLFAPVCAEFFVPITNFKGWTDLNSRAAMMKRFKKHEEEGRECILLFCGDHDPGGLHITNSLMSNFEDMMHADGVEWDPENLAVTRFGLNFDFIERHGLTWIDNLETSSGNQADKPDKNGNVKEHIRDYVRRFGRRKCEASALVTVPEIGRQLCRNAILQHVPANAAAAYARTLKRERERLRREIAVRLADAGGAP